MTEESTTTTIVETIKTGWKTTEFWTSLAAALSGALFLTGYFTAGEANQIIAAADKIIGGIMVIGPTIAYAISRGKAKQNSIDVQAIITALAAAVPENSVDARQVKKNKLIIYTR